MASYEDRLGTPQDAGRDYFDGAEFALRTELEHSHYWHVHRRNVILDQLRAARPATAALRLIELGCGIGTVATHLNEHGYCVDYGDVYGSALEIAAQRAQQRLGATAGERRFLRLDVTQPLPEEGWSGILLFDVIEHLPDDVTVLRQLHDALRTARDGFVMITVPAFPILWSPWDDLERHKRRYTQAGLCALLDRCGFSVEHSTYFFGPLFFAALGVKGLRTLRDATLGRPVASSISDLTESKNHAALNRLMLAALAPEQRWLRHATLPLGTSILAIAQRR
ncbi:MAG TPA: methyltransferase domain-containing protein [Pseudomonadota bacterium]|nr:methyltransferase domain-containing protein [Pseudomonadota bacterium]